MGSEPICVAVTVASCKSNAAAAAHTTLSLIAAKKPLFSGKDQKRQVTRLLLMDLFIFAPLGESQVGSRPNMSVCCFPDK